MLVRLRCIIVLLAATWLCSSIPAAEREMSPTTRPAGTTVESALGLKIAYPSRWKLRATTKEEAPGDEGVALVEGDDVVAYIIRSSEALPADTDSTKYAKEQAEGTRDWVLSFEKINPRVVEEREIVFARTTGRLLRIEEDGKQVRQQYLFICFVGKNHGYEIVTGWRDREKVDSRAADIAKMCESLQWDD